MGILNTVLSALTWWNGQTLNTRLYTWRKGVKVGEDEQGNIYYRSVDGKRRWVIYNGEIEASRVSPDWHGWLHHSYDEIPESHLPQPRIWEKEPSVNLTGTAHAYRPAGALEQGGHRAAATGDYESWNPAEAE